MAIKSDRWIRKMALEHDMINPFNDRQVRDGVISYGLSSYGYDLRVADEFKIFTNVNSAIVDPKNFDQRSFIDVKGPSVLIPPNSLLLPARSSTSRFPATCSPSAWASRRMRAAASSSTSRPSSRSGKALLRSKSRTAHRCRRRSIPMKACARSSSSRATKLAKSATKIRAGNTKGRAGSCCRSCSASLPQRPRRGTEFRRGSGSETSVLLSGLCGRGLTSVGLRRPCRYSGSPAYRSAGWCCRCGSA